MQIISVCIGLFAALWMLVGLVVNLLNWITLPLCVLGVIFGVFGKGKRPGLTINLVVGAVAVLRLFLGGGVL